LARIPRIGYLSRTLASSLDEAFIRGMNELGYVEGQTVTIERRYAEGKADRLREFANELVQLKVDALVTTGTLETVAAKEATSTIPIVFTASTDPLGQHLVDSLARPGGNVTGLSLIAPSLSAKRLEVVRETVSGLPRVGVLATRTSPTAATTWRETEAAAALMGTQVQLVEARDVDDLASVFPVLSAGRLGGLIVLPAQFADRDRGQLIEFVSTHGLPAIYPNREFAVEGGLLAFGPQIAPLFHHAASLVDKILKGAKPAELPVEQPTVFDLIVNLKTAQALGLTIPTSVLQQATEVIQ
jgi:putative ABC transport system substrate-binding protein